MQSQMLPITMPSPTTLFRTENGDDVDNEQHSRLLLSSSSSSSTLSSNKDDDSKEKMPFLSRALSYTHLTHLISNKKKQKRRRGYSNDDSLPSFSRQQSTLTQEVTHAASETYLITRLGFELLRYLGLDLYLPEKSDDGPMPVVAFITGGAWIIG
ncbi:hypothetical protein C5167_022885 [Papaver somniferum]|uniref:Uncharacterized protein n=1 Tax=Papaver somniferum TaxID=3469 RepID=A0A4Y7JMC1_PAPSO|nr:hypothetical protein C5167_022885 [Papaver somniferum]